MIGKKFNYLTILGEIFRTKILSDDHKRDYVVVECDCGNILVKRHHHIITGKIKSCGCAANSRCRGRDRVSDKKLEELWNNNLSISKISQNVRMCTLSISKRLKRLGIDVSRQMSGNKNHAWKGFGDIPKRYFDDIKSKGLIRGLPFEITIEFVWELFCKQNGMCNLTKLPLCFGGRSKEQTASLDRIDSNKGYTEDNVQWVHKDIQLMKNYFPQDHYVEMCKLVSQNKS